MSILIARLWRAIFELGHRKGFKHGLMFRFTVPKRQDVAASPAGENMAHCRAARRVIVIDDGHAMAYDADVERMTAFMMSIYADAA